jgi:hypothetical protein
MLRKAGASFVNVGLILPAAYPLGTIMDSRAAALILCFSYCITCELVCGRCLGMRVAGTVYEHRPGMMQSVLYSVLYTMAFSVVVIHIYFPLDLGVAYLLLDVITVRLTGTTPHGYLAGVRTVALASDAEDGRCAIIGVAAGA